MQLCLHCSCIAEAKLAFNHFAVPLFTTGGANILALAIPFGIGDIPLSSVAVSGRVHLLTRGQDKQSSCISLVLSFYANR